MSVVLYLVQKTAMVCAANKGQVMQYPIGVHCVYLICVFLDMSQVGLLLQHRRSRVSVAMHAYPP